MVFSNSKFKKNISFNRALAYFTAFTTLGINVYAGEPGSDEPFNPGTKDTSITQVDSTNTSPDSSYVPNGLDTGELTIPNSTSTLPDSNYVAPQVAPDLVVKLTKPDTSSTLPDSSSVDPSLNTRGFTIPDTTSTVPDSASIASALPDSASIASTLPDSSYTPIPGKLKTGVLNIPRKITKPDTSSASPSAPVGKAPNINLTLYRPKPDTVTVYSTKTDTVENLVDKYHPFSLVIGTNGSLGGDLEQLVAGFSVGNGRLNLGLEVGYPVNGGNKTDEIIKSDFEIQGPYKSQKITQKETESKVYDIGLFIKKSIGKGFDIGFGSGLSREDKKGNIQERVPLLYTDGRPVLNNGIPIVGKDGDSYSSENYNGKFDFRLGYEKGNFGVQAVLGIKGENLKPYAGARINFNVSPNTKTRRNKK